MTNENEHKQIKNQTKIKKDLYISVCSNNISKTNNDSHCKLTTNTSTPKTIKQSTFKSETEVKRSFVGTSIKNKNLLSMLQTSPNISKKQGASSKVKSLKNLNAQKKLCSTFSQGLITKSNMNSLKTTSYKSFKELNAQLTSKVAYSYKSILKSRTKIV